MDAGKALSKSIRQRQKKDRMRELRVLEYLDYSAVLQGSPVEISEGYVISDTEDYSIFASFVITSVSEKRLAALEVRLLCYRYQNIPYLKIPFIYSRDMGTIGVLRDRDGKKIKVKKNSGRPVGISESFGEGTYIPIPQSYFTRLELELVAAVYEDGTRVLIGQTAGKRRELIRGMGDRKKFAYSAINIHRAAEEKFPSIYVPQMSDTAWLCCCGAKNPINQKACRQCLRDRDWLLSSVNEDSLLQEADRLEGEEERLLSKDKTKYIQTKYMQTAEEAESKMKAYEQAIKNLAEAEKREEKLKIWLIPKVIFAFALLYGLFWVAVFVYQTILPYFL